MTWTKVHFLLSILCPIPQLGSVTTASGQGQTTDIKVLERGDCAQQCPSMTVSPSLSMKEREEARSELHQITNSAILAVTGPIHTCNGTPGWC